MHCNPNSIYSQVHVRTAILTNGGLHVQDDKFVLSGKRVYMIRTYLTQIDDVDNNVSILVMICFVLVHTCICMYMLKAAKYSELSKRRVTAVLHAVMHSSYKVMTLCPLPVSPTPPPTPKKNSIVHKIGRNRIATGCVFAGQCSWSLLLISLTMQQHPNKWSI